MTATAEPRGLHSALLRDDDRAILWSVEQEQPICRQQLRSTAERIAAAIGDRGHQRVWIATDTPVWTILGVAAAVGRSRPAVVPASTPAGVCPAMAVTGHPELVLHAGVNDVVAWAEAACIPTLDLTSVGPGSSADLEPGSISLWTSGTTRGPRLVDIGLGQISAVIGGLGRLLSLSEDDVGLCIAPLDHTLGLLSSVLAPLAAGGQVLLASGQRPAEVAALCARSAPTWCAAAPSTMRVLTAGSTIPARMRLLRTSGGPLSDALVNQLRQRYGAPTISAYAMTEAPGEVASQPITSPWQAGSVGRPTLSRVQIRPIDASAELPEQAGSVWVSGPNVVTAADDGWLDTGDLGYLTPTGDLVLSGRLDDLINRGGQKVSPHWVEAAVRCHPEILDCVVFAIPQSNSDDLVGLAVVADGGVDAPSIRRFLASRLPRTSVPHHIRVVASLPRTARGKVPRRELPARLGLAAAAAADQAGVMETGTDA